MQRYDSQALTDIVKVAAGATVTVYLAGTTTKATIYSDDGVTTKSNPITADSLGRFFFYSASARYDITISGTQITTFTLPNQVLFDPFEQTAADTALVVKQITANTLSLATTSGKIQTYLGITTVASGVPAIFAQSISTQNATFGPSTLYAVPAAGAGQYRLTYYIFTSTVGNNVTANLQFGWTDPTATAQTVTESGTVAVQTLGSFIQGVQVVQANASTNITFAGTFSGGAGGGLVTYQIRVEFLG